MQQHNLPADIGQVVDATTAITARLNNATIQNEQYIEEEQDYYEPDNTAIWRDLIEHNDLLSDSSIYGKEESDPAVTSYFPYNVVAQELSYVRPNMALVIDLLLTKLTGNVSDNTFNHFTRRFNQYLQEVVPQANNLITLPFVTKTLRYMRDLTGLKMVYYICCINVCMAWTAMPMEDNPRNNIQLACPHCGENRLDRSGRPRKTFDYLPFTH